MLECEWRAEKENCGAGGVHMSVPRRYAGSDVVFRELCLKEREKTSEE